MVATDIQHPLIFAKRRLFENAEMAHTCGLL